MQAIINGRKYDTATARHLGRWANKEFSRGRIILTRIDLYLKVTGEYFTVRQHLDRDDFGLSVDPNGPTFGPVTLRAETELGAKNIVAKLGGVVGYEAVFGPAPE